MLIYLQVQYSTKHVYYNPTLQCRQTFNACTQNVYSAGEAETEKKTQREMQQTEPRSAVIPSWLVALQKVLHFVFKVVQIMVNFVLSV